LAELDIGGATACIRCCVHLLSQIVGIGSGCPFLKYLTLSQFFMSHLNSNFFMDDLYHLCFWLAKKEKKLLVAGTCENDFMMDYFSFYYSSCG